jgi:CubicO group peptidase (beta-lactamase class C family)
MRSGTAPLDYSIPITGGGAAGNAEVFMDWLRSMLAGVILMSAGIFTPWAATASAMHPLTADDVRIWLDGFMPQALEQGDIAGAVAVVVKDGAVLAVAGYGYSDVEARTPVDAERTLFRVGSVSKLFTWTAVMQLVEQGKLDLDTDVNRYLDFSIPSRNGRPVTLRNIMTHTAGFEERLSGLIGVGGERVVPLREFLVSYVPSRIFAPGETPAYSNYAAALAGYIVARVSGESFDEYIDRHILEPLEMPDSTFRQPLPARFESRLSKAYAAASLPAKPFEIVGPAPAGSLTASGADMAHFMIAHLQNGRYASARILEPRTAELMHYTPLTILPRVNRMVLGFYEDNINGHRVIAHGGDTQWFHSDLHLFIDDGVGLFVAFNSTGKDGAVQPIRSSLFHEFADRYFPGPAPEGRVDEHTAAAHAGMLAGGYTVSRRFDDSFLSLLQLVGETKVVDDGDGTISVSAVTSPSGVPRKWREIAPFVWRQLGAKDLLSATVTGGRVSRFSFDDVSATEVYDRAPWWRSAMWLLPLLGAGLIVMSFNALAWPVIALTRRHYGIRVAEKGVVPTAHRWVRIACAAVALTFLAWLAVTFAMTSVLELGSKLGAWVLVLQVLSPIVFVSGAAVGLWSSYVMLRSRRRVLAKLWALALATSFLAVLWAALAFHLISFHRGF